jgi:hypothetical protein
LILDIDIDLELTRGAVEPQACLALVKFARRVSCNVTVFAAGLGSAPIPD